MEIKKLKIKGSEPNVYHCDIDKNLRPGAAFGPIVRDIYLFECNTDGYGTVVINGKSFPLKPRTCYILLPGDTVTQICDTKQPREGIYFTASGTRIGEALSRAGITSETPFAPPELFDRIVREAKKIYESLDDDSLGAKYRRTACIYEILGALTEKKPITDKTHWVNRAIAIFETDYHLKITVAEVATRLGFERTYFSVMFKEHTGISPHAYLTSLRISRAQKLLAESGYSVSDAAEAVGLDPRNFSRLFKKETGEYPRSYKNKL